MTEPAGRPWPALSPLRRLGPIALVLALLVGVGVVASTKGDDTTSTVAGPGVTTGTAGGPPATTFSKADPRSWAANPALPVLYADAKKAGTVGRYDWGPNCDPATGRLKVPTVYALPCVPVWKGTKPWRDRGGKVRTTNALAEPVQGVSADTIKVVYYVASAQDLYTAFQALGVLDSNDATYKVVQDLVTMGNATTELYGRKVEISKFQASGDGKDPAQARADAIKVATETGAFASIGGPTQTAAYQDELAKRGVLCISCGQSTPDSSYQKDAPYAWGTLASPDQLVNGLLDFGVKNLFGLPARFAGDPAMRTRTRSVGIVHYDQDPPVFGALEKSADDRLRAKGFPPTLTTTYLLNLDTLSTQAQTIVGKLKAAKVTTVVFLGDPLMPKYLTEQATKQDYFPEWVITGTVFTDSTSAGRLYDQRQWAHAFGASSLPARTDPKQQDPQRLYHWFFGTYPTATKSLPVVAPVLTLLFDGLQLAGPQLDAYTFAGGLFRYPVSGGGPTTPRISYGFHGVSTATDFTGVDDLTTVWWNAEVVGPSEQGVKAKGMWEYAIGGKRFPFNALPKLPDTGLFKPGGAVTIYRSTPTSDRTADYPPWPGSPAA